METLSKLDQLIIKNQLLSNKEIALNLGTTAQKISAKRTWLIRKGKIESQPKNKGTKKERKDSIFNRITTLSTSIKIKVTTNTYTNHNGENKDKARVKMKNYMIDSSVIGDVPCLPNENWTIEQEVAKVLPDMNFIGAEINKDTYVKMKKNLKNTTLNATTHFGKISDLIYGKTENSYAHLILDYCGHLSTFSKEIEYVINNDLLKLNGIMAITFGKPLRGNDKQTLKIKNLAPINNEDTRCISDRSIENYFAKITGWNYEVKEIFYYSDKKENGKGYPMTLVIIQRIK
jgi:hypothetical protein